MPYETRVVADSVSPQGARLTTVVAELSRAAQIELCAFRRLSRCFATSTAQYRGGHVDASKNDRVIAVVTATEWENFLSLTVGSGQSEILEVAESIWRAIESSAPKLVQEGEWHLPFLEPDELMGMWRYSEQAVRVSAARCARGGQLLPGGYIADLDFFEKLRETGTLAPLEHVATPFTARESGYRRRLAAQIRADGNEAGLDALTLDQLTTEIAFRGNFQGWTQLRKLLWGEDNFVPFARE